MVQERSENARVRREVLDRDSKLLPHRLNSSVVRGENSNWGRSFVVEDLGEAVDLQQFTYNRRAVLFENLVTMATTTDDEELIDRNYRLRSVFINANSHLLVDDDD